MINIITVNESENINNAYQDTFANYEDEYIIITNLRVEHQMSPTTRRHRCTKIEVVFKNNEITDDLQKTIPICLKHLYGYISISSIKEFVSLLIEHKLNATQYIDELEIETNLKHKLYQELILNGLANFSNTKNIQITMPILEYQLPFLYKNINYFDVNSVLLMTDLPATVLTEVEDKITMITNTIIKIQTSMDYAFVLRNLEKISKYNINYLYEIKRITYDDYESLVLMKEMMN